MCCDTLAPVLAFALVLPQNWTAAWFGHHFYSLRIRHATASLSLRCLRAVQPPCLQVQAAPLASALPIGLDAVQPPCSAQCSCAAHSSRQQLTRSQHPHGSSNGAAARKRNGHATRRTPKRPAASQNRRASTSDPCDAPRSRDKTPQRSISTVAPSTLTREIYRSASTRRPGSSLGRRLI